MNQLKKKKMLALRTFMKVVDFLQFIKTLIPFITYSGILQLRENAEGWTTKRVYKLKSGFIFMYLHI